jgi:cathepsin D
MVDMPFSGYMGLAFERVSVAGAVPFWQDLVTDGLLRSPLFSFYLTRFGNDSRARDEEPGGVMTLGGTNSSLYTGEIEYTDMPVGYVPGFWLLRMTGTFSQFAVGCIFFTCVCVSGTGLTVNGRNVSVTRATSLSVIDTGTTLIGGPTGDVTRFWAGVPEARPLRGTNAGFYAIRTCARSRSERRD